MTQKRNWSPMMTGHSKQGDQIKCLTSSDGWEFMPDFDSLPPVVRRRLAESRHNICAACMEIEARKITRSPTTRIFIEVIEAIERELDHPRSSNL